MANIAECHKCGQQTPLQHGILVVTKAGLREDGRTQTQTQTQTQKDSDSDWDLNFRLSSDSESELNKLGGSFRYGRGYNLNGPISQFLTASKLFKFRNGLTLHAQSRPHGGFGFNKMGLIKAWVGILQRRDCAFNTEIMALLQDVSETNSVIPFTVSEAVFCFCLRSASVGSQCHFCTISSTFSSHRFYCLYYLNKKPYLVIPTCHGHGHGHGPVTVTVTVTVTIQESRITLMMTQGINGRSQLGKVTVVRRFLRLCVYHQWLGWGLIFRIQPTCSPSPWYGEPQALPFLSDPSSCHLQILAIILTVL